MFVFILDNYCFRIKNTGKKTKDSSVFLKVFDLLKLDYYSGFASGAKGIMKDLELLPQIPCLTRLPQDTYALWELCLHNVWLPESLEEWKFTIDSLRKEDTQETLFVGVSEEEHRELTEVYGFPVITLPDVPPVNILNKTFSDHFQELCDEKSALLEQSDIAAEVENRIAFVLTKLKENDVDVVPLQINPADLSPEAWCELFNISINEAMGIVLWRAVNSLKEKDRPFTIHDILYEIEEDERAKDTSKEALENRLTVANKWGIFAQKPVSLQEVFSLNHINVLDLSVLDAGTKGLRKMVIDVVARRMFTERTKERRREEFGLTTKLPRVWLTIDEAHQFIPKGRTSLCKDMLIRWVKEGRQPGLSLVVATQQPAAIDAELLSQCDIIVAHKITAWEDINALDRLSATYMQGDLKTLVRGLNRRGEALLVDDETESVSTIRVRPRLSSHGGAEIHEKKQRKSLF